MAGIALSTEGQVRLLRLQDVQVGPNDRVFRHARMRTLIIWLAGFAATAVLFFRAYSAKWMPGYIFGPFLLLSLLLTLRYVTARFHSSNWLVRMNDVGIYVQYRSYLNYGMSADDPSVVFLSFGEIASARLRTLTACQEWQPLRRVSLGTWHTCRSI